MVIKNKIRHMKIYYFIIFLWIVTVGNTLGQNTDKKSSKDKTIKIEIKENSRTQMAVTRDNYHRRRDLRVMRMNKKIRMNKQEMISDHNAKMKKAQITKKDHLKNQNESIKRKRQTIQKKRLERQRQLRNRTR